MTSAKARRSALVAGLLVAVALLGLGFWLYAPYPFTAQRELATQYLAALEKGDLPQAEAMELKTLSPREFCKTDRLVSTSPLQTNGNRLRRRLRGVEVDMPALDVEFEGGCLLRVTLRRNAAGQWKVARLARHAG